MMQYSRLGLYAPRKKNTRQSTGKRQNSVDWINIFLFFLLFVVVILFIVT